MDLSAKGGLSDSGHPCRQPCAFGHAQTPLVQILSLSVMPHVPPWSILCAHLGDGHALPDRRSPLYKLGYSLGSIRNFPVLCDSHPRRPHLLTFRHRAPMSIMLKRRVPRFSAGRSRPPSGASAAAVLPCGRETRVSYLDAFLQRIWYSHPAHRDIDAHGKSAEVSQFANFLICCNSPSTCRVCLLGLH